MKAKKIIFLTLTVILSFCLSVSVYAASWADFDDISGHWAEAIVKKGYDDGLIAGYNDSTVAPDSPITTAQMITILCRVMGATEVADISSLGISPDVWYAKAAGRALNLGLISAETGNLDSPMTRQDALSMMAEAFCLVPAEPNFAVLGSFSDADSISEKNRDALSALVSANLVIGFDGALNANESITRAEFLTVLYRVASNYITAEKLTSGTEGGSVLNGSGSLNYISTGKVWFNCAAENVSLFGVKADAVTLRNHNLRNLYLSGSSDISRLIVAVGKGSVHFDSFGGSKIGQLCLQSCSSANVGSDVGTVEITGNGISVNVSGEHEYLIITGSNNVVTLSPDASLSRLKITGENNIVKPAEAAVSGSISCDEAEILGRGNTLSFKNSSSNPPRITVGGEENSIVSALNNIASLNVTGTNADIKISSIMGISDFSVTGSENLMEIGSALAFSVSVSGSLNEMTLKSDKNIDSATITGNSNWLTLLCTDMSSIDVSGNYNTAGKFNAGKVESVGISGSANAFEISELSDLQAMDVSGSNNSITVNGTAQSIALSGRETTLNGNGKVANLTINSSGCTIGITAANITDNSNQADEARVLNLVTLGYNGNYTLAWAQEHDYEDFEKEIWINAKGYTSSTRYLIWVNLSMQRVNVFKGSAGNWELSYSCIVGTGAPGRGTPVGTWKVTYKAWDGWTTSTYTVKPVVGFKYNTGYAFHSRLYYPGTSKLSDKSIGYPVSHGCVRMYDEDIMYIYNSIPLGTTVVVY